jgi:CopG family nickel-responsive transcriptional regulator
MAREKENSLIRFGISMDSELLERYDHLIDEKGYTNRSEAIRDMVRDSLVQQEYLTNQPVVGSVTLVFNHHAHDITHKLTHFQHEYSDLIIATLHVHLTGDDCMEIIALKGPGNRLKQFSDSLLGMKGVKHGKLVVTSTVNP